MQEEHWDWLDVGLMLHWRRRWWTNIEPASATEEIWGEVFWERCWLRFLWESIQRAVLILTANRMWQREKCTPTVLRLDLVHCTRLSPDMAASPSRAEVVEITAKWLFTKRDLRYLSVTGSVAAVASVLAFTSAQITAKQLQDYFDQAKKKPSRQFSDSATNVDVFVLEHSYIRVKVSQPTNIFYFSR